MLAHAAQVGVDVTVTIDPAHSVTLTDTMLAQFNAHDVQLV
jgi:hypothetical protein